MTLEEIIADLQARVNNQNDPTNRNRLIRAITMLQAVVENS